VVKKSLAVETFATLVALIVSVEGLQRRRLLLRFFNQGIVVWPIGDTLHRRRL
jgi:hypothetical protein